MHSHRLLYAFVDSRALSSTLACFLRRSCALVDSRTLSSTLVHSSILVRSRRLSYAFVDSVDARVPAPFDARALSSTSVRSRRLSYTVVHYCMLLSTLVHCEHNGCLLSQFELSSNDFERKLANSSFVSIASGGYSGEGMRCDSRHSRTNKQVETIMIAFLI